MLMVMRPESGPRKTTPRTLRELTSPKVEPLRALKALCVRCLNNSLS